MFLPWRKQLLAGCLCILGMNATALAQDVKTLTLPEAIGLGVQNSKVLKLSQEKVNQAIAQYQQTKDRSLPTGNASFTYNHAEIPSNKFQMAEGAKPLVLPKRAEAFIGTVTLQEVIFAGNKLKYAQRSTELLTQVARLDAEKDQEDIAYNITNAYFNLFKLQQSQQVVAQNLVSVDRQIKQAQRFFEQGIVTRNDVLRFQLQRSNVELSGADLETNRKIVVYQLNLLLGLPENGDIRVEPTQVADAQNTTANAFIEQALANRRELKSLDLHATVAENQIKTLHGDKLPVVALAANMYYINPSGAFIPPAYAYLNPFTAGATVAWNFDSLWLNKNKEREAKIQKTQVDISRTITSDQVKTEVYRDYQQYLEALNRIRILDAAIAQARENEKTMASRYTNSVATATERIDAQTQLFQALINMELARADAGLAYYTLLKSTGSSYQK